MLIAISGAGGFIGKQLTLFLQSKENEIRSIARIHYDTPVAEVALQLAGVDVVINLAGAPVIGRWTKAYKKNLLDSRIITTRKIVEAIGIMDKKPGLLISASAIGIYSQEGEHTENNFQLADDYLGQICSAWELEAKKAKPLTRVAITRFGIVLGKDGGALKRMLPLFRFGLGGRIASGKQGFSWIHVYDVVHAIYFIIGNKKAEGEFNFTAPQIVDNSKFTSLLAGKLRKSAFFTVPLFALRLVFGEGSIAVAGGQFVKPQHLLEAGYEFDYPELSKALDDIIM
jgi:uncharacterized protein (TIGR01777 family)